MIYSRIQVIRGYLISMKVCTKTKSRYQPIRKREALKCNGYLDWIMHELREENSDDREVKRPELVKETSDRERNKKIPVVIIHQEILCANQTGVRKIRHPNILQADEHVAPTVG